MYYYIINPAAGGGKINKIQDKLKARLKELGILGEFVKSIGAGDVEKLTKIGIDKGYKTIIAVGGDGTINEVINGIKDSEVTLGIIPVGTTNELAKLLGIPEWQSACNILAARKTEVVNMGKLGDRLFVTNISIGFDAFKNDDNKIKDGTVFSRTKFLKRITGINRKPKQIGVTLDFSEGYKVEADCINVTVSSSKFTSLSQASSKSFENSLEVTLLNKLPFRKIFNSNENKIDYNYFSVFKTKKVTINTKKPVDVFADGVKAAITPVEIGISEKKLRVIVSKDRKF